MCRREKVKTHVEVTPEDETGSFSIVHVKTRDRPGLLTDIVRTLKDLNVNVISAEVGPPNPLDPPCRQSPGSASSCCDASQLVLGCRHAGCMWLCLHAPHLQTVHPVLVLCRLTQRVL